MTTDRAMEATSPDYRPSFAINTIWTWASVAISMATAFLVPPLLIRRLGDDAYGIWALVFGVVEYYTLLDFGLRSAVVKYVAQHWALGEQEELDRTLNTAFVYLAAVGAVLVVLTIVFAPVSPSLFHIPRAMTGTFVYMTLVLGVTWALGVMFQCFSSCLEAVQRFDLSNRILIVSNIVRTASILILLQSGFGLAAIATAAAGARLLQCLLLWGAFTERFPGFRWRLSAVDAHTFRKLCRFGLHTVPGTLGTLLLIQGPIVAIAHSLPERYVGYYALPGRVLYAGLDLVYRLAMVTNARASELVARRERQTLIHLGIQSNRYGLALFMPAAVFLGTYGEALFRTWLTPPFAAISSPLLGIFLISAVLADAAHSSSGSMLYAMAKHRIVSQALLVESILSLVCIYYFVQRADLFHAALAGCVVAVLNRGGLTPYLLCRQLQYPTLRFIREVSARPLAVGAVTAVVLWSCRQTWLPGESLFQLGLAGFLCVVVFTILAGRYCVLPLDRIIVLGVLRARIPALDGVVRTWLGLPAGVSPIIRD